MKKKANYPGRVPSIACPHCDTRAIARDSCQIDRLTRNIRFVCDNPDCGHIFAAQIGIYRTLRKSEQPRADVANMLPLGAWVPQPANDDDRCPANDDRPLAAEQPPLPG